VNEGYVDADVVAQAQWARSEEDGKDKMKGAGSEQQTRNMQQVKKSAQEINEMKGIDEAGIREAQVAPDQDGQQGESDEPAEPQGPPCMGCGEPTEGGPVLKCQIHPRLAEQLGIAEISFGMECAGEFVEWWAEKQQQTGLDDELAEAEQ